jgi:hypothetical protein
MRQRSDDAARRPISLGRNEETRLVEEHQSKHEIETTVKS